MLVGASTPDRLQAYWIHLVKEERPDKDISTSLQAGGWVWSKSPHPITTPPTYRNLFGPYCHMVQ